MKKWIAILICIATTFLLCVGCNKNVDINEQKGEISTMELIGCDNNLSIENLRVSDIKTLRLLQPYDLEGSLSSAIKMNEIKSWFNSYYIRKNNGSYYMVIKTLNDEGLEEYLFMLFDNDQVFIDGMLTYKLLSEKAFDIVIPGKTTIEEVKKIDKGTYLFDGRGENQDEAYSYHRFLDGKMMIISYKKTGDQYIVNNTDIQRDPTQFVSLLLPKDLALIKSES